MRTGTADMTDATDMTIVTRAGIRERVRRLQLAGRPVEVHSSLRSFGHVEGGPRTVVDGLLAEGCTVMVPTFSYGFSVRPLPHQRPARNGTGYRFPPDEPDASDGAHRVYRPDSNELSRAEMCAIPAEVVALPGRVRGIIRCPRSVRWGRWRRS